MAQASGKFGLNRYITSSGSLGTFDVIETQTAKFVINNASPSNIFIVKGKIAGQSNYVPIDTLIGSITKDIDITKFDYIEIECTTFSSLSTYVQIDGSGFLTSLSNSQFGDINVSISLNPGDDGVYIGDKTTGIPLKVNNDGSINVNGTFVGGDASAANQVIGNNYLQSINQRQQGSLLANIEFDEIQVDYPTATKEVYTYYSSAALVRTIEITYSDSTKRVLTRVRKL